MVPMIGKDPSSEQQRDLVSRILVSHHLAKAAQLRELLLYLAEMTTSTPAADVTEQEIGFRVLGRRQDYDPQDDNIVRVQIRRLRQKLDEYFASDGRHEPLVATIPKGSHVLRFEPRTEPDRMEPPVASPPAGARRWLSMVAPAILLGVAAFALGRFSLDRSGAPAAEHPDVQSNPLWSRLFSKERTTTIVLADSSLVVVQNVLQKDLTLNEYIDRSYREAIESLSNAELRDALRTISTRQYTSLADATVSGELRALGARMGARIAVRYSRHMNIRDFHSGNFILIGSRHGVPWVELFEPSLNFRLERVGPGQRFGFRNLQPMKGEAAIYANTVPSTGSQESFATICLVPNLGHNGSVLLLSGVSMEATEAAGEYFMSDDFPRMLAKVFGAPSAQRLPSFEILLKTAVLAGAPHKVDVVAWRKPVK